MEQTLRGHSKREFVVAATSAPGGPTSAGAPSGDIITTPRGTALGLSPEWDATRIAVPRGGAGGDTPVGRAPARGSGPAEVPGQSSGVACNSATGTHARRRRARQGIGGESRGFFRSNPPSRRKHLR